MSLRVVTVIQARTGSTRLPGKVLKPLCGRTVLEQMLDRVQRSGESGMIVVATTTDPRDDAIESISRRAGTECFRGHPTDLLDRHYQAGMHYRADAVVKIPSDCPLIDPLVIDRVIGFYRTHRDRFDYVSNLHPPTYPDGNDVEVMAMAALETAWNEAGRPFEREHTTPFLWDNPHRFRVGNVRWETGLDHSRSHRWVLDYEGDYRFIEAVYESLYPEDPAFGMREILDLIAARPDIAALNRRHLGEAWYDQHRHELKTLAAC
jgi:spore coat polysaccharide biosynthesis protein SpsF